MPYDVVLVDDQKIMRDGIKAILKNHDDFRVVAETDDGARIIRYLSPRDQGCNSLHV
jgi:DNA-binding NarL/FixJ family response regulator